MNLTNSFLLFALMLAMPVLLAGCQAGALSSGDNGQAVALSNAAEGTGVVEGRILLAPQLAGEDAAINLEIVPAPEGVKVETVVEGLEVPWDLAFTPDGRILVTERPGRIRVIADGQLLPEPYATIEVAYVSEAGLMGIALHPDFPENGYLYVCYTYWDGRGMYNRISRLTDGGSRGTGELAILDRIPGASRHDGCRLGFGPDGRLYATTGDATRPELSQDLDSLAGKVLRMTDEGDVPPDNPFPGSLVYSWGHRNPQGLAWHPVTGDLFITEHGPASDDEVNIIEPGRNYGWPEVTGAAGHPDYTDSLVALTPTVAIAGTAFVSGSNLPETWEGNLVFAALKSSHLQRVALEAPDYRAVASRQTLFRNVFGRLRAVVMGPDGHLYFTTSNRDGRGSPRVGDDKLLRLAPAASEPVTRMQLQSGQDFRLELVPGLYLLRWDAERAATEEWRVKVVEGAEKNLGVIELGGYGP